MSRQIVHRSFIISGAAVALGATLWAGTWKVNAAPPDASTIARARVTASATNSFALHLLPLLAKEKPGENIFYSPTSLSLALSLAATGAGGNTRQALVSSLGFEKGASVDALNAALQQTLADPDPKVTLNVANAIWADRHFAFRPDYKERARKFYRAQAQTLTMADPAAASTINSWVAHETRNKITKLVSPDSIRDASAVLTNAVYFNGKWTTPFPKTGTHDESFTPEGEQPFPVPMMHLTEDFGYLGNFNSKANYPFDAVRLPYGTGKWAMYAFLPAPGTNLGSLVQKFTPENWARWRKAFQNREVQVGVPRFKAEYESIMNQPLSALGMKTAFSNAADFRPMFTQGDHRIDAVVHKAVLEVKEEGTEAAAATGIIMMPTAVRIPEPQPVVILNRPFLCTIANEESGAIVFMGAIYKPEVLR